MHLFSSPARLVTASLITCALLSPLRARAAIDWNEGQIDWRSYEDGLAEAKAQKKPVCLILFAEWCPHCKNYGVVFHDPKVVAASKQFVMIRLDVDQNQSLDGQWAVDGGYVPRTFFLLPDGSLNESAKARVSGKFQYFYDERRPDAILAGMEQALKKAKKKH